MNPNTDNQDKARQSRFVRAMSGRRGLAVVAVVTAICTVLSAGAVWLAWDAVKGASQPASAQPAVTDSQTRADETDSPVTIAPESDEPAVTETPETAAESTGTEAETETETETEIETETETETEPVTEAETAPPIELDGYVVCLDAGHGYDDHGTDVEAFGDWAEKDIVLDICLRAGQLLTDWGVNVIYTRPDDVIPPDAELNEEGRYLLNPYAREAIMKSYADIHAFVSVHVDYYEADPAINGPRMYYYRGNHAVTDGLVRSIAREIAETWQMEKTPAIQALPWEEAFYVTKCTSFPSILLEIGFATNPTDAANMMKEDWRQDMAESIARGIAEHLGLNIH